VIGLVQPYLQVRTSAGGLRDLSAGERQQIGDDGEEIYDCGHSKVRVSFFISFFLQPTICLFPLPLKLSM
jgi:hypothetical protein